MDLLLIFAIDNPLYETKTDKCEKHLLKHLFFFSVDYCKLMKYFKFMDKTAKIYLAFIRKVYYKFPKTQAFCKKRNLISN